MNLRHFGITVSDLNIAQNFYEKVLGFEVVRIMDESGEHIDNFSNLKNVAVRTVKMRDRNGGMLELLQYHSHLRPPSDRDIADIGCSHFAVTVEDLDDVLEKVEEAGFGANCEPQFSPDGKVKLTFCRGPDDVLIEMVQEL
jgi:catechol 2,3-dioxygenase-like lactoylglutathione lyase family enzyme